MWREERRDSSKEERRRGEEWRSTRKINPR
jgi:hypothetical protein